MPRYKKGLGYTDRKQVKVLSNRKMKSAILGTPEETTLTKLDQLRAEEYRVEKLFNRYHREAERLERARKTAGTLLKRIRIDVRREERREQRTRDEADSPDTQRPELPQRKNA